MSSCFFFIPARGGSKRFPLKNIAPLQGKPLVGHVIDSILEAAPEGRIVVSTDDSRIKDAVLGLASGRAIEIDGRPAELGSDQASVAQVLREYLERRKPAENSCFCVYPTAALLAPASIRQALEQFEGRPELRSLMGASEYNLHPWQALYRNENGSFEPFFKDIYRKKAQELPRLYGSNGSFYLVRCAEFIQSPDFYAGPLELQVIPAADIVDVNYPEDLGKIERILALAGGGTKH